METGSEPILAAVLRQLDAAKGDWPAIAKQSGVPYQTLAKIGGRVVSDPRVSTVQALLDCLGKRSAEQRYCNSATK
ncbi:hypothetical protein WS72_07945 [Burkholderia savannae]|uniref:DNA-binding protein n=2 Tax=Burkholderiaceae TaxID=119060 RepID=A0ABR5TCU8_9BURK|nr:hypothetical protein [Burkholderia savannae]KWZ42798.1 hypothetical protein WS72_07945 [Burkholderia savannae]